MFSPAVSAGITDREFRIFSIIVVGFSVVDCRLCKMSVASGFANFKMADPVLGFRSSGVAGVSGVEVALIADIELIICSIIDVCLFRFCFTLVFVVSLVWAIERAPAGFASLMVMYFVMSNEEPVFGFIGTVEERYSPFMRLSEGIVLTGSSKDMIWIPNSLLSSLWTPRLT